MIVDERFDAKEVTRIKLGAWMASEVVSIDVLDEVVDQG